MSKWTIKGVAETVGLAGLVVSIVFVGFEVRQATIATRASTNATVAESFIELNLVIAASPDLARAFAASFDDPEKLSIEQNIMVLGGWRSLFHVWSNAHRQWTNGTLDRVLYDSVVSEISTYGKNQDPSVEELDGRSRSMRWAWESERFIFNQEFQQFVDELIDTRAGTQ